MPGNTPSIPGVRPYLPADRDACLNLFDSNVPEFFAATERRDFIAFLDDLPGPYYVLEDAAGMMVACGGYAQMEHDASAAALCWGMVLRDRHKEKLGTRLLEARLSLIRAGGGFKTVEIETTPFSRGFFERYGFREQQVKPDGFAPGFDLVKMTLFL